MKLSAKVLFSFFVVFASCFAFGAQNPMDERPQLLHTIDNVRKRKCSWQTTAGLALTTVLYSNVIEPLVYGGKKVTLEEKEKNLLERLWDNKVKTVLTVVTVASTVFSTMRDES